mgnify:CR=1 FL=1
MFDRLKRALEVLFGRDQKSIPYLLEKIMASVAELTAQVNAATAKLAKIGTETQKLLKDIADLKLIIAQGTVTPELQAAVDALAAQAGVVDDLVEDAAP